MAAAPIISVENLGKRYIIDHAPRHDTLRDTLAHGARGLLRRWLRRDEDMEHEEFWALRDISFEVQPGEVMGIIGLNGAGKSTLLKILSRITEPTTGRAVVRGRVASLLEVGTGFHPELSGRENIFLNGAILGMTRAEIARKFDEIVAFAEVERFLDTPVKRYSSGMYVRLAFAVAAHLEPEILIVDEVLAVGDADFQAKCLGKVRSVVQEEGRTVLLVSHNLLSVQQFCTTALSLREGRVVGRGEPRDLIDAYLGHAAAQATPISGLVGRTRPHSTRGEAQLTAIELVFPNAPAPWKLPFGQPLRLRIEADVRSALTSFELGVGIFSSANQEIVSLLSSWQGELGPVGPGRHELELDAGDLELVPGRYRLGVGLKSERGLEDYLPEAVELEIVPPNGPSRPNLLTVRGAIARSARYRLRRL